MPTVICPRCNKPLPPDAQYCGRCGMSLQQAAPLPPIPPPMNPPRYSPPQFFPQGLSYASGVRRGPIRPTTSLRRRGSFGWMTVIFAIVVWGFLRSMWVSPSFRSSTHIQQFVPVSPSQNMSPPMMRPPITHIPYSNNFGW